MMPQSLPQYRDEFIVFPHNTSSVPAKHFRGGWSSFQSTDKITVSHSDDGGGNIGTSLQPRGQRCSSAVNNFGRQWTWPRCQSHRAPSSKDDDCGVDTAGICYGTLVTGSNDTSGRQPMARGRSNYIPGPFPPPASLIPAPPPPISMNVSCHHLSETSVHFNSEGGKTAASAGRRGESILLLPDAGRFPIRRFRFGDYGRLPIRFPTTSGGHFQSTPAPTDNYPFHGWVQWRGFLRRPRDERDD